MFTILYVDDDPGLLDVGRLFLEQGGQFSVETVTSATQAFKLLHTDHYDAIISDYQMPEMDGIEFLKRVRASGNTVPFIIFTGRGREEIVIQALNEGADFYLQKGGEPLSQFAELKHKVRQAVQQRMAEASIRDHERREADIINFLPDATFAIDTRGVVIAWNRAMEKMTGVPAPEILGKGNNEYALPFYHERRPILIDLVLSEDPAILARYPYVKQDGRTLFSEITIPHFNDGRGAALWFTASPLDDTGGNIVGAIESIREITEWKRSEEAKNESERRFRELADMLPQIIYEVDTKGTLTYANRIAFELFGYNDDEFRQGLNVIQMIAPADRERAASAIRAMLNGTGRTTRVTEEYLARRKDGSEFPVAIYSSAIVTRGSITGLRGIIVDITDRRRAQERIRESEQRYRNVVEDQTEFICRFRPDGTHVFVNEAYCRYFSLTREDIIGHRFRPDIPLEDRKRLVRFFRTLTVDHPVDIIEHRIIMPDGSVRWQRWSDRAIFASSGAVIEYQSVGRDTTEKKEAEEALHKNEEQYRILAGLLDLIPASVTVHDPDGRFLYANQKTFEYHGYTAEEFYRMNLHELDVPESEQLIEKRINELRRKGAVSFKVQHFRKDRSVISLLINAMITTWDGAPVILSVATDIPEQKTTEAVLQ